MLSVLVCLTTATTAPRWIPPAVHWPLRSAVAMNGARPDKPFSLSRLTNDAQMERVTSSDVSRGTLSYRVREALLDAEEQPYTIWSEPGSSRPLRANLDLLTFRGRTLARKGNLRGARDTYERCVAIDPRDGRSWLALARMSERAGDVDEAIKTIQRGLKEESGNAFLLQVRMRQTIESIPIVSTGRAVCGSGRERSGHVPGADDYGELASIFGV